MRGEALGERDGLRVRVGPQREERELTRLLACGLGQLRAAVPGLHHEESGEPVEVALAVAVPDVRPLAAHDHRNLLVLVRREPGEVHPQIVVRGLLQPGVLRGRVAFGRGGLCGGRHRVPQE